MSGKEVTAVPVRIRLDLLARADQEAPDIVYKRFVCHAFVLNLPRNFTSKQALVDTGAPFSILPRRFWWGNEFVDLEPGAAGVRRISGVSGGELPCRFGWARIMLADTAPRFSDWLEVRAKLAETDSVPLILGVADLLDRYEVVLNSDRASYITVPGPALGASF